MTARSPWPQAPQYWLRSTDSTMNDARALLRQGTAHGTLVVADYQSAGHGNAGRRWVSSRGRNLLFNLVVAEAEVATPSLLPLWCGEAVAAAIDQTAASAHRVGIRSLLKWPNDILMEGGKVAGVLCERQGAWYSIGVGVTCNQRFGLPGGPFPATSLGSLLRTRIDRLLLLERILSHFDAALVAASRSGAGADVVARSIDKRLYGRGCRMQIANAPANLPTAGTLVGLAADGALIVRDDAGRSHHYYSGRLLPALDRKLA